MAVTVIVDAFATGVVATAKVAVVCPERTETEVGTDAAAFEAASEIVRPPDGAAEPKVTVPVAEVPPMTLVGATATEETDGGLTVRLAVFETPLSVAVMVAELAEATATVPTAKVAVDCPAGTVTDAGTVTPWLLDWSDTTIPPVGAELDNVIVPTELEPPVTEMGFKLTDESTRLENA